MSEWAVMFEWIDRVWQRVVGAIVTIAIVTAATVMSSGMGSPAIAATQTPDTPTTLSSQATAATWNSAPEAEKLAFCTKAYQSFRSAPAQSYIISSNVQAMTPETFCDKLDRFYGFELHEDTTLAEAAALAPLLFADLDG